MPQDLLYTVRRRTHLDLGRVDQDTETADYWREKESKRRRRGRQRSFKKLVRSFVSQCSALLNIVSLVIILCVVTSYQMNSRSSALLDNPQALRVLNTDSPVSIASTQKPEAVESSFHGADTLDPLTPFADPDYGGLDVSFDGPFERVISENDEQLYQVHRYSVLMADEWKFQLEWKSSNDPNLDRTDELEYPRTCYRNNWQSRIYPTCNNLHELAFTWNPSEYGYQPQYLSHGYFRDTWAFDSALHFDDSSGDEFVLKTLRIKRDINFEQMQEIEKEAIVMERLTSSPRIIDAYGLCGTSLLTERMVGEVTLEIVPSSNGILAGGRGKLAQSKLDELQVDDVHPMNNLTVPEKLEMALVMAESLADIHGFEGGVIAHGDVHPDQWLRARDGSLKLNDFNNGMFLEFNRDTNEYCDFYVGYGGVYKAPEELRGDFVNEAADVWAMGQGIYGLLTGLYPYYQLTNNSGIRAMLLDHQVKPYVDPRYRTRSLIEGRLVEIMERCWEFDPTNRVDIFTVVQHLRETLRLQQQHAAHR